MFERVPSIIENRFDPEFRRRRRIFNPMMFEEIMHMGIELGDPYLGFLFIISFFKEDFPWIYEIGLETYKELKIAKTLNEKNKIIKNFERAFEMLRHPMMMEFAGKSEEMYMFSKDIRHFMHRYFSKYLVSEKSKD